MDEIQQALDKLDNLEGLDTVKKFVHDLTAQVRVHKLRKERGLPMPQMTYHMAFGGTSQTETIAGIIGDILHALGALSVGHLVTVNKENLLSEYIGQTTVKTREIVELAMGGVLLINDAHTFSVNSSYCNNDFEALDTLHVAMVEHQDNLVVIFAGEKEKLTGFLNSHPGIATKVPTRIDFDD